MVVYGEMLFMENTIIGAAILYLTAQVYGASMKDSKSRIRMAVGSLLCGGFSFIIFTPVKMPFTVLLEGLFAWALSKAVFGKGRAAITFVAVTCVMGGITLALLMMTKNECVLSGTGIYTGDLKAGVLALFICISFAAIKQTVKTIKNKKARELNIYEAIIKVGDVKIDVKAFVDTGNCLKEPLSGKPVAIADENLWRRIKERGGVSDEKYALIPYKTVGGNGIMEAVRCSGIYINESWIPGGYIAKGEGKFQVGDECELIVSESMINGIL